MDNARFVMMGQISESLTPSRVTEEIIEVMDEDQADMVLRAALYRVFGDFQVVNSLVDKVMGIEDELDKTGA